MPAYLGATFGLRACNFLAALILIRTAARALLGELTVVWVVAALLAAGLSSGLDWRISREAATDQGFATLRDTMSLRLALGCVVTSAATALSGAAWGTTLAVFTAATCSTVTAEAVRGAVVSHWLGSGRPRPPALLLGVGAVCRLVVLLAVVLTHGAHGRILTQSLGFAVVAAGEAALAARCSPGSPAPSHDAKRALLNAWGSLVSASRALIAMSFVSQLYSRCDALLLAAIASLTAAGQYGLWLRFLEPYMLILGALQPVLVRGAVQSRKNWEPLFMFPAVALGIPFAIIGPELGALIFGVPAMQLQFLRLLPLFILAASASTVWQSKLVGRQRIEGISLLIAAVLCVNLAIDVALIPRYGAWGAAVAATTSECLMAASFFLRVGSNAVPRAGRMSARNAARERHVGS